MSEIIFRHPCFFAENLIVGYELDDFFTMLVMN